MFVTRCVLAGGDTKGGNWIGKAASRFVSEPNAWRVFFLKLIRFRRRLKCVWRVRALTVCEREVERRSDHTASNNCTVFIHRWAVKFIHALEGESSVHLVSNPSRLKRQK